MAYDPTDDDAHGPEPDAFDDAGDEARRRRLIALLATDRGVGRTLVAAADGSAPIAHGNGAGRPDPGGQRARLGQLCAVSVSEVGVSGAG